MALPPLDITRTLECAESRPNILSVRINLTSQDSHKESNGNAETGASRAPGAIRPQPSSASSSVPLNFGLRLRDSDALAEVFKSPSAALPLPHPESLCEPPRTSYRSRVFGSASSLARYCQDPRRLRTLSGYALAPGRRPCDRYLSRAGSSLPMPGLQT